MRITIKYDNKKIECATIGTAINELSDLLITEEMNQVEPAHPADDWEEFRRGCPAKEEADYGDGRNLVEICTLFKGRWPCIKENCVAYRAAKWGER